MKPASGLILIPGVDDLRTAALEAGTHRDGAPADAAGHRHRPAVLRPVLADPPDPAARAGGDGGAGAGALDGAFGRRRPGDGRGHGRVAGGGGAVGGGGAGRWVGDCAG